MISLTVFRAFWKLWSTIVIIIHYHCHYRIGKQLQQKFCNLISTLHSFSKSQLNSKTLSKVSGAKVPYVSFNNFPRIPGNMQTLNTNYLHACIFSLWQQHRIGCLELIIQWKPWNQVQNCPKLFIRNVLRHPPLSCRKRVAWCSSSMSLRWTPCLSSSPWTAELQRWGTIRQATGNTLHRSSLGGRQDNDTRTS